MRTSYDHSLCAEFGMVTTNTIVYLDDNQAAAENREKEQEQ